MLAVLDDTRFAPAPEKAAGPSLWALLPEDFARRGHTGDATALFARVQRTSSWRDGAPAVGRAVRSLLATCDASLPIMQSRHASEDGATRVVLSLSDGHRIECVHMPRAVKNPRVTLCVSSQVGCAMGCTFCATGTMGIKRNLTAGEIVGEVLALMHAMGPATGHSLNVVFMGMGEPLHNLEHVARAIEVLCHPMGVGMAANRITVSTSGLVPGIERLARLTVRPLLAVSVNATTDSSRSAVMPVNRAFNLARLKEALLAFPQRRGEKILLEYVLLRGVNDSEDDAIRLAEFARGLRHNVNVIPLNEHAATDYRAPENAHVQAFARRLSELGCLCTIRKNRGRDVSGACGQLVQKGDGISGPQGCA